MNVHSKRLLSILAAFPVAAVLLGCPLLKKSGADAGAEAEENVADAATVTVSGSGAKNEHDVLRYAKEQKLNDEPAVIAKDGVEVRTFPSGAEVATLSKGTPVVKLAKYFSTGVLIRFEDPEGGQLMGWVTPDAVVSPSSSTPTATAKPAVVAPKVDAGGGTTKPTDAGSPVDAGAPADGGKLFIILDAGAAAADAGKTAPVTADAGANGIPTPAAGVLVVQPTGGKCPTGFTLMAPLCRRACKADAECPRGTVCKAVSGSTQKACTNP